jgi:predicted nucleic acid-binding protein
VALTHLADTSVLSRVSNPQVRSVLERHAVRGSVARAGITDLEISFSARNGEEWDRLAEVIDVFPLVETTDVHFRRARHVQRLLAEKTRRGRKVPDLLVAAAAEDQGLVVLHYDADFDLIAGVTGQPTEWVAVAGSID